MTSSNKGGGGTQFCNSRCKSINKIAILSDRGVQFWMTSFTNYPLLEVFKRFTVFLKLFMKCVLKTAVAAVFWPVQFVLHLVRLNFHLCEQVFQEHRVEFSSPACTALLCLAPILQFNWSLFITTFLLITVGIGILDIQILETSE